MTSASFGGNFAPTQWTRVLAALDPEHPEAREALEGLCHAYWTPLYAYARRSGKSPVDAEDLTQGFFARLLRLDSLARVRREQGRFRSFLLAAFRNYLADERDRERAAKRGADRIIRMDAGTAETAFLREPADPAVPPDVAFDRAWARMLLRTVADRLREDYAEAGQAELFEAIRFSLTGEEEGIPYAELAAKLRMSGPALRVAIHRLRARYRRMLREEVAKTVPRPEEIDDELRHLRRVLSG